MGNFQKNYAPVNLPMKNKIPVILSLMKYRKGWSAMNRNSGGCCMEVIEMPAEKNMSKIKNTIWLI